MTESECAFQPRVGPYHDGELDADDRRAVAEHVERCAACAAELAWLQWVSGSVAAARPAEMTGAERRRVAHAVRRAVEAEDEESDEPASYSITLYRAAGAMMAVAASILIISWAWMGELPGTARPTPGGTGTGAVAAAEVPAWERVALTLRADPLPNHPFPDVHLADARLADWMLDGLSPGRPRDESR
jgi:anti-sigma factor RsiW